VFKLSEFLVGAGAKLYHTSMQELTALLIIRFFTTEVITNVAAFNIALYVRWKSRLCCSWAGQE
jgi:hypothetical protein